MPMDENTARASYWAVMPADVLANPTLGDKAKLIYAEISRMIGPAGYCWARDKYLAERVGCSIKTVSRAIHDLAAAGLIRVEMSANHNGTERHIYAGLSPAAGGMDTSDQTPPGGMDMDDQTPMDKYDQPPPPTQYKVNNKNINISARARGRESRMITKEAAEVFTAWAGDDRALLSKLAELAKVRASQKKPYTTAQQAKLLTSKLTKLSGGDRAMMLQLLDEAIEHGWLTVYPPKGGAPAPTPGRVEESPDVTLWQPDEGTRE